MLTFNALGGGVPPLVLDFRLAQPTEGRMNVNSRRYFEKEDSVTSINEYCPPPAGLARLRQNRCKFLPGGCNPRLARVCGHRSTNPCYVSSKRELHGVGRVTR